MSDSKDPTSPFAPLDNKGWLDPMPRMDLSPGIDAKDAEITRLRAALADAQVVGFAAGVETAAKVAVPDERSMHADQSEYMAGARHAGWRIHGEIRALTPPDATAAAARVLLGDDIQIARMAGAVHDGPLGAGDYWFSAATKQGAWCVDVVRAALRAIAGDTP